ncbi:MAG: lnt [Bacteroidetes bacterium]|jgi:apolipoprotein N-acyltransferase|nr:lnt [Bacteroidota bacterium]
MVKNLRLLLLALISALLLSLAWQAYFTVFIFIAFVPLLFIADEYFWPQPESVKRKGLRKFGLFYLLFLTWNLITTWWVYNASPAAYLAWTLNALFMVLTISSAWWVKKRFKGSWSYFIVIPFWLSFEYLHQHWDLSWTWLTVGNVFAHQSELVQWYEITGTSGGSAWVWAVNILIYLLLKKRWHPDNRERSWNRKHSLAIVSALLIPALLSYVLYVTVDSRIAPTQLKKQQVVVVQPNIDPYNEKFSSDPQVQIEKTMDLIGRSIKLDSAAYLVFPETFLTSEMWEDQLKDVSEVRYFKEQLIDRYPDLAIVSGANTYKQFARGEKLSATAHKFLKEDAYYDSYNAAIQIDKSDSVQVYHKSILVPGAEIMPFLSIAPWLEQYALDMGGTSGSLGLQEERGVFKSTSGIHIGPIICYESIYPEYVTEYVKNGANMLFIITNDGWWGDTPGYKQHMAYGSLRAIETRKPMARSANTGISCFIDERGKIFKATKWWEPRVIEATLRPNTYQTIFVRAGDLFAKCSLIAAALLLIFAVYKRFAKR